MSNKIINNDMMILIHELKTPLNAIIHFSDYIAKNLQKELTPKKIEKMIELAKKIKNNGLEELTIIDNLLRLNAIENGKFEVVKEEFDIKEVIESVLYRYDFVKNIEIDVKSVNIVSDKVKLRMIFKNIFSNALKYSNTLVKISTDIKDDYIDIIVEDDGDGIKDENKDKIFSLFEGTNHINSTGIGLYTVKLLSDLIDCKIIIEDSILGGAKFIIRL